jgi:hypothetical protein
MPIKGKEPEEEFNVFTLCKSSTDEQLNSGCTHSKGVEGESGPYYKLTTHDSQLKAQEVDLNYPCLVSNIGLSRIMIQSMTNPNQVNSFKLDEQNVDFICFADYQSVNDIGFKDTRD